MHLAAGSRPFNLTLHCQSRSEISDDSDAITALMSPRPSRVVSALSIIIIMALNGSQQMLTCYMNPQFLQLGKSLSKGCDFWRG